MPLLEQGNHRGLPLRLAMKPLLVGLTGNFGAGKTTAARLFRKMGAHVLSADRLTHEVFQRGNRIYPRIQSLFPELRGRLNRSEVAEIVFRDSKKRRALESEVHPYVLNRIQEEIKQIRSGVVLLEVPLLFESGFHRQCDLKIVVKAPAKKMFQRLLRRGFRTSEIEARWKVQMPLQEKIRRADYVIDNSNGLGKTRVQVVQIWKELSAQRERSLSTHGKREREHSHNQKDE